MGMCCPRISTEVETSNKPLKYNAMALEFDKEDLKYIKSTIEWMLENMHLKSTERVYTEDLHNLSMNSITALERGLAQCSNENAALPIFGVSGSLRDKFASDALNGLMLRHNEPGYTDRDAVNEAYKIADMMMERREQ